MSAHDVKLFGDAIAAVAARRRASRRVKASSLLRLAIEDLFPGRIALVSSFGADSAVLLHMVAQIDQTTPVVFVDTGQHFPETLAYRDALVERLGLTNVVVAEPDARDARAPRTRRSSCSPAIPTAAARSARCCRSPSALDGYDAWITGRKGFQSATARRACRCSRPKASASRSIRWSAGARRDILDYIRAADLPPHPLVAKGFPVDRLPALHQPRSRRAKTRAPAAGAAAARPNAASTPSR